MPCEILDRIENRGRMQGRIEGRIEGKIEGKIEYYHYERKLSPKEISQRMGIEESKVREIIATLTPPSE